jgi:photosynthetic reaction center cytochrome c subunit
MKQAFQLLGIVVVVLLGIASFVRWERPPIQTTQLGPDGLAMEDVQNPRRLARLAALNAPPAPIDPVTPAGTKASQTYQNVKVLGDLDTEQFNRLMTAITEWVAPREGDNAGCNYCHNPENLADDSVYTKVVARRMIEMTRHINSAWQNHVQQTGVTCYTCHRGNPVPQNIWFSSTGLRQAGGMAASRQGQNLATKAVGSTSLPYDPFTDLFAKGANIRVVPQTALPAGFTPNIKDTEKTYGLMMHLSQSLGVNCTFCHNSRSFTGWAESRPQRVTAWHGIKMVSDLNAAYLEPLRGVFPPHRLGAMGDVAKIGCGTCHQGVNKPLLGVSMVKDYPELSTPNPNP